MRITRIKPVYNKFGKLKGYIDKYTSEEYGFPVIISSKRNPYAKGWFMANQEAIVYLAQDREIKGETYKVLLLLLGNLEFENWIKISITEIANQINIDRSNASKAIKILEQKEIIERGKKIGRFYEFRLSPYLCWKGKVKTLEEYRQQEENKRLENLKFNEEIKKNKKIENLTKKYKIPFEELMECLESYKTIQ